MGVKMQRQEIETKALKVVEEQYSRVPATVESDLVNDLNFDSLETIELTMFLEEEFDITIPDEVTEKWKTVKDIVDYICTQKP